MIGIQCKNNHFETIPAPAEKSATNREAGHFTGRVGFSPLPRVVSTWSFLLTEAHLKTPGRDRYALGDHRM